MHPKEGKTRNMLSECKSLVFREAKYESFYFNSMCRQNNAYVILSQFQKNKIKVGVFEILLFCSLHVGLVWINLKNHNNCKNANKILKNLALGIQLHEWLYTCQAIINRKKKKKVCFREFLSSPISRLKAFFHVANRREFCLRRI